MDAITTLTDNWTTIAEILGAWALLASLLNRVWPRPESPRWLAVLHVVLIDWPAMLPSTGMRGAVARGVLSVPFVTTSRSHDEPPPTVPPAALIALAALPLAACEAREVAGMAVYASCVVLGTLLMLQAVIGIAGSVRRRRYLDSLDARESQKIQYPADVGRGLALPILSDADARAMADAIRDKNRRAGIPSALALALLMLAPGCALSHQTRAGLAFVAVVPTIEAGVRTYADLRIVEEHAIGADAVKACAGRTDYDACTDAIVKPRRQRLDDARLAIGTYASAISSAASGAAGDLAGAAQRVLAALAALGIRIAQEVR